MCSRLFVLQEVEDRRIQYMKWYGCKPYTPNPHPHLRRYVWYALLLEVTSQNLTFLFLLQALNLLVVVLQTL